MKQSLLNQKIEGKNKVVKFNYTLYFNAVEAICQDILENYDIKDSKIGIIGLARGALPLLVSVSHGIGIRRVSTIQLQMSNSDNCHDYGEVRIISECIDDTVDKFILLEDIIYKGKTTNAAIDLLKRKGKEVLCVYSLVIDEEFKNIEISNHDIPIKYAYEINQNDWVYFLWEENIDKI